MIAATGVLHHPRYPDIDGLDRFQGALFHSARWDHSVPLEGKRIGVVGTGSTAVQITGALVDVAADYRLFQRTAPWIMPAPNAPIPDDERDLYRADPVAMRAKRAELASVFEGSFANAVIDAESKQARMIADMCRANLEDSVTDPELREALRPTYRAACKRLILSPNFYDAIQRPNAHLVTSGIDHVEETGVRTVDGELHELDVLVLATGFQVDRFVRPIEIVGRDGVALSDVWAQRPSAYLSISIPDFPNLFLLNGPNGPVGNLSLITVAELQVDYVMQLIALATGEPRREVRRAARGAGPHRGRAGGGRPEDGVGHRVQELVPRRPWHPRDVAVGDRPLPRGDGRAGLGRLRGPRARAGVWLVARVRVANDPASTLCPCPGAARSTSRRSAARRTRSTPTSSSARSWPTGWRPSSRSRTPTSWW